MMTVSNFLDVTINAVLFFVNFYTETLL